MLTPVTLEGMYVRLEPLALTHLDGLCAVGLDTDLWRLLHHDIGTRDAMREYVEEALEEQRLGKALPFATIARGEGKVAGSTRFANIETEHRRLEIGWTWVARPWQRSAVNTEAKLLMLTHAFETLGCQRVELKTDALNQRSRAAILRLGAKQEGIFRKHMLTASGRVRDTVYFSIIDEEWPVIRSRLLERVSAGKLQEKTG